MVAGVIREHSSDRWVVVPQTGEPGGGKRGVRGGRGQARRGAWQEAVCFSRDQAGARGRFVPRRGLVAVQNTGRESSLSGLAWVRFVVFIPGLRLRVC